MPWFQRSRAQWPSFFAAAGFADVQCRDVEHPHRGAPLSLWCRHGPHPARGARYSAALAS